jgi:hypothetical protein
MPGWLLKRLMPAPQQAREQTKLPSADQFEGYRAQALDDLNAIVNQLSSLTNGRRTETFRLAATIGKYVPRFLSAGEVEEAMLQACSANGGEAKHGVSYLKTQIRSGLKFARTDSLPPLMKKYWPKSKQEQQENRL